MTSYLKRLLGKLGRRPTWRLLVDSPRAVRQYERWVAAQTYLNWTGPWFKAYHYRRADLPTAWPVEMLRTADGHNGVALLFDERIGPINFQHLFRLLRDRVLALGYRVAIGDERCWQGTHHSETMAKYVLHPIPSDITCTHLCNQRFGQVTVDLVCRGRQPVFLRLTTMPLPGEVFTLPQSFDELLAQVLGCDAE